MTITLTAEPSAEMIPSPAMDSVYLLVQFNPKGRQAFQNRTANSAAVFPDAA